LQKLLAANKVKPEEIKQVRYGFLPGSDTALVSTSPKTGLEGKFSIEYCTAAVLLDGRLAMETFTDDMVQRPSAQSLIGKVKRERIEAKGIFSGVTGYTDIAVETVRGTFTSRQEDTPGSPQWPMTPAEGAEKYTDCARRALGSEGATTLLSSLGRMAELGDVRALVQATMPAAREAQPAAAR
jgi:2-methylcitrate dehydratase PrpD